MQFLDETGNSNVEKIGVCIKYFQGMVIHISEVWKYMTQEFESLP
jgi:hypothetical protein